MRICPKCGFVDPSEWKHSRYSYWIDHIMLEDFKKLYPELAQFLTPHLKVKDKDYVYRLTKNSRRVERKALVDYGEQWNIPMERASRKERLGETDFRKHWILDGDQRVMTEFMVR